MSMIKCTCRMHDAPLSLHLPTCPVFIAGGQSVVKLADILPRFDKKPEDSPFIPNLLKRGSAQSASALGSWEYYIQCRRSWHYALVRLPSAFGPTSADGDPSPDLESWLPNYLTAKAELQALEALAVAAWVAWRKGEGKKPCNV